MRNALILGGAGCVFDDVDAALDLGEFDGAVGCNHVGIYWRGRLDAWVTLHPENFKPWRVGRANRGLPEHAAHIGLGDTDHRFPGQTGPGSSGLFALKVALVDLGFDRAVLCGMPLSPEAEHFDAAGRWRFAETYHPGWREALPQIKDRARSMGGWTQALLGAPDEDWLRA